MKSVFWGASLDVQPLGLTHIELGNYPNEIYAVQRPTTSVKNVIIGSMYIEHHGPMTVKKTDLNDENKNQNDSFDFDNVKEVVIDFK
jgi:hypothetical protein